MECEKFIKKKCGDIFEIKSILFEVVEGCPVVHMNPTLGYCEIVVKTDGWSILSYKAIALTPATRSLAMDMVAW